MERAATDEADVAPGDAATTIRHLKHLVSSAQALVQMRAIVNNKNVKRNERHRTRLCLASLEVEDRANFRSRE